MRINIPPQIRLWVCFSGLIFCMMALSSCATRKIEVMPEVLPDSFSREGSAPLPEKWWTAFEDSRLDQLIEQALEENFSLRAAWDRLEQARAIARKAGADLLPALQATASASRTRTVTTMQVSEPSAAGDSGTDSGSGTGEVETKTVKDTTYGNRFSLGLLAEYELDLWGRIRSAREAALLDMRATEQDVHTAAITLSAEIASAWFKLIEQFGQLRLLDDQIATNEKQLEVITLRFRRGLAAAPDVLQQEQLVEAKRGERIQVTSTIETLKHYLAVLIGEAPGTLDVDVPTTFPELPPLPETGLPAEWIRKRPDIHAAEFAVMAVDKRVGESIANQFPRLSISLSADTSDDEIGDLFDNWAATLAANMVAPLFEGGARRAEVRRTYALLSESLNSYNQTVLDSLREVEDALTQESRQSEYLTNLDTQISLSQMSTELVLERYIKGSLDFTRYLTTLVSYQNLQSARLQGKRDLIQYRIDLYRALAGSWELERPVEDEISKTNNTDHDYADDGQDTMPANESSAIKEL